MEDQAFNFRTVWVTNRGRPCFKKEANMKIRYGERDSGVKILRKYSSVLFKSLIREMGGAGTQKVPESWYLFGAGRQAGR